MKKLFQPEKQDKELVDKLKENKYPSSKVLVYANGEKVKAHHPEIGDILLAERESNITALIYHKNTIYDGTQAGVIRDTIIDEWVASRYGPILTFCSYDGILHDGGEYYEIHETLKGTFIAERPGWVHKIFEKKGQLYDYGEYSDPTFGPFLTYNTLTDELDEEMNRKIVKVTNLPCTYAPKELIEEFIKK